MTDNPRNRLKDLPLGVLAAVALLGGTISAAAQEGPELLAYQGVLGDVIQTSTPNPGKVHVSGAASVATADFFRGIEDNEPEDLGEFRFGADLIAVFELWESPRAGLSNLNLALGTTNGFWSDKPEEVGPVDSDVENWYESDNYVGLTAQVRQNWLAGLTYTVYTSPNDVAPETEEIALTGAYTGRGLFGFGFGQLDLIPQLKLAVPIDEGDGFYTELQVTPALALFQRQQQALGVELTLPITLGVGWDDYYGGDAGTTGYLGVGLGAALPLEAIPSDYGNWTLSAGIDLLLRESDLEQADRDDDDLVIIGGLRLGFAY